MIAPQQCTVTTVLICVICILQSTNAWMNNNIGVGCSRDGTILLRASSVSDHHDDGDATATDMMHVPTGTAIRSRRNFVSIATATTFGFIIPTIQQQPAMALSSITTATAASQKVQDAISELQQSRDKLQEIPDLLEAKEWDKVRSILKVPPVNKLWNLGDVRASGCVCLSSSFF
jgi:hypothetical protein